MDKAKPSNAEKPNGQNVPTDSDRANDRLRLEWLPGRYAVCRLGPHARVPEWARAALFSCSQEHQNTTGAVSASASGATLFSQTRTDRELSLVVDEAAVPPGVQVERGFVALWVADTLEFSLVGVLAKLTGALADAGVPVFVISTFETDVLLVRDEHVQQAVKALSTVASISSHTPPAR